MTINTGTRLLTEIIALVALAATTSGCGADEEGATESVSSNLLSNVPYLPGNFITAKAGTSGDATLFGSQTRAYFAYIRPDSTIGIIIENDLTSNGQNPTSYYLPQHAQFGTSLLALGNTLYLFYVDSTTHLSMMTSQNGVNWSGPSQLNSDMQWNTPPSAVAWQGVPHVYISGSSFGSQLMQTAVVSGTSASWSITNGGGISTFGRPSATIFAGLLYLAWANSLQSGQPIVIMHTGGFGWSNITGTGKNGIPTLYTDAAGDLEMFYRGTDSHIYRAFSNDGVSFGQSTVDSASTTNHAVIPFKNWNQTGNWVFYVGVNNGLFTVLE